MLHLLLLIWIDSLNLLHYRLTECQQSEITLVALALTALQAAGFCCGFVDGFLTGCIFFFPSGSATPHCFATKTNLNVDKAKSANLCTSNMHARTQF